MSIKIGIALKDEGFSETIEGLSNKIKRFTSDMEQQSKLLQEGVLTTRSQRAALKGLNEEQRSYVLNLIKSVNIEKEALQVGNKQRQAVNSTISALQKQVQTIGKTAEQIQLMELHANGATKAEIKQAEAMLNTIKRYREYMAVVDQRIKKDKQQKNTSIGVSGSASVLTGLGVGLIGGTSVTQLVDEWTNLNNRLKLVHQSQNDIIQAQKSIANIANVTGQSINEVATIYQRFAQNQKALNLTQKELVNVTELVAMAISLSGVSAASGEAALAQFGQAMASGVLRGEEFNSVMEQAPALAQALAQGLGVGIASLREMAGNGELTAKTVIKALQASGEKIREDYAKTSTSISSSFQVMKNKFTEFIGGNAESSGAASRLSSIIIKLSEHVGALSVGLAGLGAVMLAGSVAQGFSALISLGSGLATAIAGLNPVFFAVGAAVLSAATALNSFINVLSDKDAANIFSNGLDSLLDTLGVLDSKTQTLGTALYDWFNPVEKFNKELDKSVKKISEIKNKLDLSKAFAGYNAISPKIEEKGGALGFQTSLVGDVAKLSKSIQDTVLKYREKIQTIGLTNEQLDKLKVSLEKEEYLRRKKIEFEEHFKNETPENRKALVNESMRKTEEALEIDFKNLSEAMREFTTATKAAEEAQKNNALITAAFQEVQTKFLNLGKTAEQIETMRLSVAGATDAQISQISIMREVITQYERQAGIMKTLKSWEAEGERIGKTEAERKLLDLRDSGATQKQINAGAALLELNEAKRSFVKLEQEYKNLKNNNQQDSNSQALNNLFNEMRKASAEIRSAQNEYNAAKKELPDLLAQRDSLLKDGLLNGNFGAINSIEKGFNEKIIPPMANVAIRTESSAISLDNAAFGLKNVVDNMDKNLQNKFNKGENYSGGLRSQQLGVLNINLNFNGKVSNGTAQGDENFLNNLAQALKTVEAAVN